MFNLVLFALAGLVIALLGLALLEVVIRRSDVGAGLALGLVVLQESQLVEDLSLLQQPVSVGPSDVLFVIFLAASVARFLRTGRLSLPQRLLVLFGILVAGSLIAGVGPFGLPAATNEARKFLVFISAALYFSTVEPAPELLQRIGRIWLVTSGVLAGLALLRWGANTAGITGWIFGEGTSLRVIPSDAALIVAQGALIALPLLTARTTRGLTQYLAPALLVILVLLQHRTVWLVAAFGLIYLLFRERALTPRILGAMSAAAIVFGALTLVVFDDQDVAEQLVDSSQATGTFEWRVAGWQALLNQAGPETPLEVAVGMPFGGGWERTFEGWRVDVTPHNFYVESYLRVGALGVGALLLVYAIILRGPPRQTRRPRSPASLGALPHNVLHTIIGMQLLYYITYSPDVAQAMLVGLGCAAAAGNRQEYDAQPSTSQLVR